MAQDVKTIQSRHLEVCDKGINAALAEYGDGLGTGAAHLDIAGDFLLQIAFQKLTDLLFIVHDKDPGSGH